MSATIFATILNPGKRVFAQPMSVILFFISRAQTPISHEKPSPAPLLFNLKNWIRQPQRRRPCGPAWRPSRKGGEGLSQEQEGGGKETAISAGGKRRERGVRRERESISALLGTQTLQKLEIWSMSLRCCWDHRGGFLKNCLQCPSPPPPVYILQRTTYFDFPFLFLYLDRARFETVSRPRKSFK